MNTRLPTKVSSLVFALATLLVLASWITASRYRATAQENANENGIASTAPNDVAVTTAAVNPSAPCAPSVSCSTTDPAFSISNTSSGHGLYASSMGSVLQSGIVGDNLNSSAGGYGVSGYSFGLAGVFGFGKSENSNGVYGNVNNKGGSGILGRNDGDNPLGSWGVFGFSPKGFAGVFGAGGQNGVFGQTNNKDAFGVFGKNDSGGIGVFGQVVGANGTGVLGRYDGGDNSSGGWGVFGFSPKGYAGVFGSGGKNGVFGVTSSNTDSGVFGKNDGSGFGVFGFSVNGTGVFGGSTKGLAADFAGRTRTRELEITGGLDLAEQFEVKAAPHAGSEPSSGQIQPGLVVSIDTETPGKLVISGQAYDHRVAGVISGAGGIKPGLTMKQEGTVVHGAHLVALTGRVYCWADASNGAIKPGDLLTTSDTPGHAMKVTNHQKANGAIIGKAMTELKKGKGLVLVLVTLQ